MFLRLKPAFTKDMAVSHTQDEKEAFQQYMEKFGECRDGSNPGHFQIQNLRVYHHIVHRLHTSCICDDVYIIMII